VALQDDYDPLIIDAYKAQPRDVPPVPALRAAFASVFAEMSAEQITEQRERIALIISVPRLRAAMIDQFSQAMQLLATAMAERAGRQPDDFKVRTVAGAIVGALMAVLAEMAHDPSGNPA